MPDSPAPSLTLTRRIAAAPARVFEAWTEPRLIAGWWRPMPCEQVDADIDLRVGGRYRIAMRALDGELHEVSGEYRDIAPARRLQFTWAWRSTPERVSLVTVDLAAEQGGTLLTLTHERFFDDEARDRHRGGWQAVLDGLVAAL